MLEEYYTDCGQQIARYGRFMYEVREVCLKSNRHPISDADDEELDRLACVMKARSPLYKQEIYTALIFAQEARIELKLGPAQFGEFSALTVGELLTAVMLRAQVSWGRCRGLAQRDSELAYAPRRVRAVQLFWEAGYPALPNGEDVRTMLEEEFAHARVYLRQRQAAPAPITAPADDPQPEPSEKRVLLSVERWSNLAIGIDEHWRYWALVPRPESGAPFAKREAVELSLPGDRWKGVLEELASSETGDSATRADLIRRLKYLPPNIAVERDRRARPGAIEAADVDGLKIRQNVAMKRLKDALGDLRRDLNKLIAGPKKMHLRCLRVENTHVKSGFVVRFLVRDDSGCLRFGSGKQSV